MTSVWNHTPLLSQESSHSPLRSKSIQPIPDMVKRKAGGYCIATPRIPQRGRSVSDLVCVVFLHLRLTSKSPQRFWNSRLTNRCSRVVKFVSFSWKMRSANATICQAWDDATRSIHFSIPRLRSDIFRQSGAANLFVFIANARAVRSSTSDWWHAPYIGALSNNRSLCFTIFGRSQRQLVSLLHLGFSTTIISSSGPPNAKRM